MDNKRIIIDELSDLKEYKHVFHLPEHGEPLPSSESLYKIIELIRRILFPGYYGDSSLSTATIKYYIGVNIDKLENILSEQIKRGLLFEHETTDTKICRECEDSAEKITAEFIKLLPKIRMSLSKDVKAAYNGDPAAKGYGEVIFCYPVIRTLTNYRIAHELLNLGVPLIPRIITEIAHSETGIDIHPGAEIGEFFTIDHGTGVVIGETTIIGNNVKIYQGVTLGAKSFPLDKNGNPIKGIARHPIVEDNVIIYAESTILGRVKIGKNSVIGGNVWVTDDVSEDSKILQFKG